MLFEYKAIKDNKVITNKIEAENEQAVVNYLKDSGVLPISVKAARLFSLNLTDLNFRSNRLSSRDIVDFTRQVSIMLHAGLTIVDSLGILKKQVKKKRMLKVIEVIDEQIRAGNSFSGALKIFPEHFSNMYISLIRAGEASGKLGDILLKLAENLEKDREIKSKLKSALIYPALIVVMMFGVMFIMITFVLPNLLTFYKEFKVTLPASTQILVVVSTFSSQFWPFILLSLAVLVIIAIRYYKSKPGRYVFDSVILKLPVISNIFKMTSLVDSTRTLSLLIGSGVSILDSLNIIIETTDNVIFQNSYRNVLKKVEKGTSFGSALESELVFPPIFVQMALVGESTGFLDDTLMRLSKFFESESEIAIKSMTTLIEPTILIVLGIGVGFLVVSVVTPIYNFTSSIQ